MPNSQFIKISKKVLDMDISNEAKILYTLLVAKINYSKYKDKKGKYFFLSKDCKAALKEKLGVGEGKWKRTLKCLRDNNLIRTTQFGTGIRVYFAIPKETEARKKEDKSEPCPTDQVGQKPTDPLNKNKQNYNSIPSMHNIKSVVSIRPEAFMAPSKPTFIQILSYWNTRGFKSNPLKFWNYYEDRKWIVSDSPVRDWRRLADKWESTEFVPLPDEFYTSKALDIMDQIPDNIKDAIIRDQEKSNGLVTKKTLYKLNNVYLQKQK